MLELDPHDFLNFAPTLIENESKHAEQTHRAKTKLPTETSAGSPK